MQQQGAQSNCLVPHARYCIYAVRIPQTVASSIGTWHVKASELNGSEAVYGVDTVLYVGARPWAVPQITSMDTEYIYGHVNVSVFPAMLIRLQCLTYIEVLTLHRYRSKVVPY
jgi:hypothetical protein